MGVQELRYQFWILYNPSEYSNRTLKKLEKNIYLKKKEKKVPFN